MDQLEALENTTLFTDVDITVELLISAPTTQDDSDGTCRRQVVQSWNLRTGVCQPYTHNPSSSFLIVTNSGVAGKTLEAWRSFIRSILGADADIWNLTQYAGLEHDGTGNVLTRYAGKTIIGFGDPYTVNDTEQRSIYDYLDPTEVSTLAEKGTSFVFVHQSESDQMNTIEGTLQTIALSQALQSDARSTGAFDEIFHSSDEFVTALKSIKKEGSFTPREPQRYLISPATKSSFEQSAKLLRNNLRKLFIFDRFLITDVPSVNETNTLRVFQCYPRGQAISVAYIPPDARPEGILGGLSALEAYVCVSSLPFRTRLDMLLTSEYDRPSSQGSASSWDSEQSFELRAAMLSVKRELHDQITRLTSRTKWTDSVFSKSRPTATYSLLGAAHDKIATTLNYIKQMPGRGDRMLTPAAEKILSSIILSACPQNDTQDLTRLILPLGRTRSTIRKGLLEDLRDLLGKDIDAKCTSEQFKIFQKEVSKRTGSPINQAQAIDEGIRQLIGVDRFVTPEIFCSVDDVVPDPVYMPSIDLEHMRSDCADSSMRRTEDVDRFRRLRSELCCSLDNNGHGTNAYSKSRGAFTVSRVTAELPAEVPQQIHVSAELAAEEISPVNDWREEIARPWHHEEELDEEEEEEDEAEEPEDADFDTHSIAELPGTPPVDPSWGFLPPIEPLNQLLFELSGESPFDLHEDAASDMYGASGYEIRRLETKACSPEFTDHAAVEVREYPRFNAPSELDLRPPPLNVNKMPAGFQQRHYDSNFF